jgi:hypothetical protein
MSTRDTMTPLLSTPWIDASGKTLSVRTLPGLRPERIKTLNSTFPGFINPAIRALLAISCGLAGSPTEGWRAGQPETTSPVHPIAAQSLETEFPNDLRSNRWVAGISRRLVAAIALSGVAMPSLAADLVQTLPHLWVSAAALSLTLITAANRPKN